LLKNKKTGTLDPLWLGTYKVLEIDHNGPNAVTKLYEGAKGPYK